jgi:hypothetical protein
MVKTVQKRTLNESNYCFLGVGTFPFTQSQSSSVIGIQLAIIDNLDDVLYTLFLTWRYHLSD